MNNLNYTNDMQKYERIMTFIKKIETDVYDSQHKNTKKKNNMTEENRENRENRENIDIRNKEYIEYLSSFDYNDYFNSKLFTKDKKNSLVNLIDEYIGEYVSYITNNFEKKDDGTYTMFIKSDFYKKLNSHEKLKPDDFSYYIDIE